MYFKFGAFCEVDRFMRRIAILAGMVWLAVAASVALFTLFWRIEYYRPHAAWGLASLAAMISPIVALAYVAGRRALFGPNRMRATGWLLLGATPLVWVGGYFGKLSADSYAYRRDDWVINAPMRISMVWASSIFDIEARWRYPRWTYGQHVILIDDYQTPNADRLVAQMDDHIRAMAKLLGQPVPNVPIAWVRGPLFGQNNVAILLWALCGQDDNPGRLTSTDRHEVAHTLIAALAGPGQDPPAALGEGWAESQSGDREEQIMTLAGSRAEERAYLLQELIEPYWYGRSAGPAYWEGAVLVHYLIEHYGAEQFLRLYGGVRRASFQEDCQLILGDSWATIDENFWKWVDTQAKTIAASKPKTSSSDPGINFVLSKSVDPRDWQSLVDAYRVANKDRQPLPSDAAFSFEGERVLPGKEDSGPSIRSWHGRVFCENQSFWIREDMSQGSERVLTVTPTQCADLVRNDDGSFSGAIQGKLARRRFIREVRNLFDKFRGMSGVYPLHLHALTGHIKFDASWTIQSIKRPAKEGSGRWQISYTSRTRGAESDYRSDIELDPAHNLWVARDVSEGQGLRTEFNRDFRLIGGAALPWSVTGRTTFGGSVETVRMQFHPMSQAERERLKQEVEQVVRIGPVAPIQWLRRLLLTIATVIPFGGVSLLWLTRNNACSDNAVSQAK
jgi:hypothetical protein